MTFYVLNNNFQLHFCFISLKINFVDKLIFCEYNAQLQFLCETFWDDLYIFLNSAAIFLVACLDRSPWFVCHKTPKTSAWHINFDRQSLIKDLCWAVEPHVCEQTVLRAHLIIRTGRTHTSTHWYPEVFGRNNAFVPKWLGCQICTIYVVILPSSFKFILSKVFFNLVPQLGFLVLEFTHFLFLVLFLF